MMTFLFAVAFLGWAHMLAALRSANRSPILAALHFLCDAPLVIAVWFTFYLSPANQLGVPGDARDWVPAAIFAFGVASIAVFVGKVVRILKAKSDNSVMGWRIGISVGCVICGIYLTGTAVDHWAFFADTENSGTVAMDAINASDTKCHGMAIVRLTANDAEYRCPHSIILANMTSQPFVPWPSYDSERSRDLKVKLETLRAQAIHLK